MNDMIELRSSGVCFLMTRLETYSSPKNMKVPYTLSL
jgi:hypothetical protein